MLGSRDIGHWSEQLGDTARISDGHTRTIELLAESLSQASMSSRNGSIRLQRMLCVPVLGTEHMLSSHSLPLLETSDMCRMRRTDTMIQAFILKGFLPFLFLSLTG